MADLALDEASENYKGLLIQYCQERGMQQPTYTETQHGPADAPCWQVTVSYGDHVHQTPEPVPGSKKFAHQIASQQVLAEINSRRESFLAGDTVGTIPVPVPKENGAPASVPIEVPMPLMSSALTIANERLTTSQPSRYRTLTDAEFSEKLSKLTLQIVRSLLERAEKDKVTFR
ncbi:MAG: putative dsRNA-binding protein [Candidatus Poribacteria bacterium]|nr:putative dsRNA-binding protein [Candidatus Poribacteria bacterium]